MATKQERTSYATSNNLKTAFIAKSAHPPLDQGQAVYDGAGNDQHLLVQAMPDGSFRTINVTNAGTSFDFVDATDTALVRFYNERELGVLIAGIPGVTNSSGSFSDPTWTWVISFNGQNYSGSDTSKPDAIAKALIKVVNAATNFRLG